MPPLRRRLSLAEATRIVFQQHPDAAIFTSLPGLGDFPSARLLGEIGDNRTRLVGARGLEAYAGAATVTRASGKKFVVLHRTVKNQRLAAAACQALQQSRTIEPICCGRRMPRNGAGKLCRAAV